MKSYGIGPDGVPFHRFGSGSKPLVILPGVMDPLAWNSPSRLKRELLARYYFRGLRQYDVWFASRPPGLMAGETTKQMASRYEQFLERRGNCHLLGLTLGGMLSTHLARERPDLVDRLVLVGYGTVLGSEGRTTVEQWREFAHSKRWSALHVDYARWMYASPYSRLVSTVYRLCSPLLPTPQIGADVATGCGALLQYDGRGILESIEAPTLVVADTDGPLFPLSVQRDAASRVQNGYVATIDGGHAVYEQSRRAFANVVTRFLGGQHTH